jgi:hypothetical protein
MDREFGAFYQFADFVEPLSVQKRYSIQIKIE